MLMYTDFKILMKISIFLENDNSDCACVCVINPNIEMHMTSVSSYFEKYENNWLGINKVTDILKGHMQEKRHTIFN